MRWWLAIAAVGLMALPVMTAPGDAPGWRGDGSGVVSGGGYPVDWSEERNIAWRVRLHGHGHSSPVVSGDAVVLVVSNGDGTQRAVLCFDRTDGELRWRQTFTTDTPEPTHRRNGYASVTPVIGGDTVYARLGSIGVVALAMDDGEVQWKRQLDVAWGREGAGAGLRLFEDLLIVQHGAGEGTRVEALSTGNGGTVWQAELGVTQGDAASLATPVVRESAVGAELIVAAPGRVVALNPLTGRAFWRSTGVGETVFASPVLGPDHLAIGDGDGSVMAMQLPGAQTGDVSDTAQLWQRVGRAGDTPPHLASGVIVGRHLFLADAGGRVECVAIETGEVRWRDDIEVDVWSSLYAAEGHLYITDMTGTTHLYRAADRLDKLRTNTLGEGDYVTATPAFSAGQIFMRTARYLYCIGLPAEPE